MLRIDERMGRENIEASHRIPDLHSRRGFAYEQHLAARNRVLVVNRRKARLSVSGGVVDTLALPHGIEREDQITKLREALAATLISIRGLAIWTVAHLEKDSGKWRLCGCRNVEIRGDEEARLAFVNEVLHAVALTSEAAGYA